MKPVPAIISPENIFFIRQISQPYFSGEFHFHEECQLAYIIKGCGKRIVGDSVAHFVENELVFIGSNLPHVWYNTEKKYIKNKTYSLFHYPCLFPRPGSLITYVILVTWKELKIYSRKRSGECSLRAAPN